MRALTYGDLKRQLTGLAQSENSDEVTLTERQRHRHVMTQVLAELNLRETIAEDYVVESSRDSAAEDLLRVAVEILNGHNPVHGTCETTLGVARTLVERYA